MFEEKEKETEIETGSVDSVDNVNWSWEATDLLNHTPTESTTTLLILILILVVVLLIGIESVLGSKMVSSVRSIHLDQKEK